MSSAWMVGRALLAMALMVGYFVLGITVGAGLVYIGLYAASVSFRLALVFIIGGAAVLWSMLPRRDRFVAPGPRLEPQEQPQLFEKLNKLALSVGQTMPKEVYLIPEVNAWVSQRGGIMGLGSRRVMGIGLPLLQLLTVSQFEAVLAHEFGHFHGGDTRVGPWLYRTRSGIGRTIHTLMRISQGESWLKLYRLLQIPFIWYGNLFLRTTHAVSRIQELSADQLAANAVGARALAEGLRALHRNAAAFGYYLDNEVAPALRGGYRPPLVEGFTRYLQSEQISNWLNQSLENELAGVRNDPYDTHPPLGRRLAALEHMPAGKAGDNSPALCLLEKVADLEARMMSSWMPPKTAPLKPLSWEETGKNVVIPGWKELCRQNAGPLNDVTLDSLLSTVATIHNFAKKTTAWTPNTPVDALRDYASSVLGAALGCAVYREGWQIDNGPGYLWMRSGDITFNPFRLVEEMRSREFTQDKWYEMIMHFQLDPKMSLAPPS